MFVNSRINNMMCDWIKKALEIYEDVKWQKIAQKREITFSIEIALSHSVVWSV